MTVGSKIFCNRTVSNSDLKSPMQGDFSGKIHYHPKIVSHWQYKQWSTTGVANLLWQVGQKMGKLGTFFCWGPSAHTFLPILPNFFDYLFFAQDLKRATFGPRAIGWRPLIYNVPYLHWTVGVAKIFRFTCRFFWSIPKYSKTLLQSFREKQWPLPHSKCRYMFALKQFYEHIM